MQYKITSDLHLNHANMIKWYPKYRNFGDKIEDMNRGIIRCAVKPLALAGG